MQQPTEHVASRRADWPALIAIGGVGVGWFLVDAIALRVGHASIGCRFYELAALIDRPSRLLTGAAGSDPSATKPFVLLCCAAIAAALAPQLSSRPIARLGACAPLVLMILCGGLLYFQASRDAFVVSADADAISQALTDLGNAVARRPVAVFSRHLEPGAGSWVSGIGAVYLACTAIRRRRPAAIS